MLVPAIPNLAEAAAVLLLESACAANVAITTNVWLDAIGTTIGFLLSDWESETVVSNLVSLLVAVEFSRQVIHRRSELGYTST